MTTQDIRRQTFVQHYSNNSDGAIINYFFAGKYKTVSCGVDSLYNELLIIGSIDYREEFEVYKISQWDALSIVIRHELANEIEKENGMLNLDKAIENLKK